jgi:hypothetical protein
VFAAGFLFLLGSAAAVALGQLEASRLATLMSLGFSAGAVACTVVAVLMKGHR